MHNLPVILDGEAGPKFLQKDQLTPFLKSHVNPATTATRFHDTNHKPLQIVCSLNLYVHAGQLTEIFPLIVCRRLSVPAIFECDFLNIVVLCIYPRKRSVKVLDESTLLIIRLYKKQHL